MYDEKIKVSILQILAYVMIARFSCIALSNIRIFSMGFIFIYGVVFIMIFVCRHRKITKREVCALGALLLYTMLVVFRTIRSFSDIFNTQAFNAYILVFLYFIYLYMKRIADNKKRKIMFVAIAGYLFTYIYSIPKLIQDPLLSRQAAANIVSENSIDTLNAIGGFDTVYGSIIVICFFIYLLKNDVKGFGKLCSIIGLVSGTVFLFLASYGTAVVLFFLMLAFVMYKNNKVCSIVIVGISVGAFFLREQIGEVIYSISHHISFSEILKEKMQDISYMLLIGESAGTLAGDEGRLARMRWSINAFLKYPIFGGYGKADVSIGLHSEIFDMLGRFGIAGFVFFSIFVFYFIHDLKKQVETLCGKNCIVIGIILFLIISFLDPSLYTQQILPFFVLLPFFDSVKNKKYDKYI